MRLPHIITVLSIALLWIACEDRSTVQRLQAETEKVHDEAMKDVAAMMRVERGLRQNLTALEEDAHAKAASARAAAKSGLPYPEALTTDTLRMSNLRNALAGMEKANDDMMAWMAQYKAPDDMDAVAAEAYLKDQLGKITRNREDIRKALETGNNLLEK